MAATGKTPILLYGSTTATNVPIAGNLTNSSDGCEIAINVADKNLFFKDATNTVNTVPIRQSSASSNGWLSSTDWSTFNSKQTALVSGSNIKTVNGTTLLGSGDLGTINVGYGGTGLTSVTAGYIPFGSTASALTTSSTFTYVTATTNFVVGKTAPYSTTTDVGTFEKSQNAASRILISNQNTGASAYAGIDFEAAGGGWQLDVPADVSTFVNPLIGKFNGTEKFRFKTDGSFAPINGGGIDFSATAGTGTSELLADYEEGTWTPVLNSFTGTATVYGAYTKVGRLVTIYAYMIPTTTLACTNITSYVSGIPYTPAINGQIVNWSVDYGGKSGAINVGSNIYTPTIAATSGIFYLSMTYYV